MMCSNSSSLAKGMLIFPCPWVTGKLNLGVEELRETVLQQGELFGQFGFSLDYLFGCLVVLAVLYLLYHLLYLAHRVAVLLNFMEQLDLK